MGLFWCSFLIVALIQTQIVTSVVICPLNPDAEKPACPKTNGFGIEKILKYELEKVITEFLTSPIAFESKDRLEYDIHHDFISAKGFLENLNTSLSDIKFDFPPAYDGFFHLNLTLESVNVTGYYYIEKGDVGDLIELYGNGTFSLNWYYFTIDVGIKLCSFIDLCLDIDVTPYLKEAKTHFENLLGTEEMAELFSKGIGVEFPEMVSVLWQELKDVVEDKLAKKITEKNFAPYVAYLANVLLKMEKPVNEEQNM